MRRNTLRGRIAGRFRDKHSAMRAVDGTRQARAGVGYNAPIRLSLQPPMDTFAGSRREPSLTEAERPPRGGPAGGWAA